MDNFVFAVLPKKTAAKMQKELQDLVKKGIIFCNPVVNEINVFVHLNFAFLTKLSVLCQYLK